LYKLKYFSNYFLNKKDGNQLIEEEELDGFVKDLMDLVKKVFEFLS
jgi:hypothetical protein